MPFGPNVLAFPVLFLEQWFWRENQKRRKGRRRKTASENEKLVQMFWNKWHVEYDLIGVYFDHILTVNKQDLNNLKISKPSYQFCA